MCGGASTWSAVRALCVHMYVWCICEAACDYSSLISYSKRESARLPRIMTNLILGHETGSHYPSCKDRAQSCFAHFAQTFYDTVCHFIGLSLWFFAMFCHSRIKLPGCLVTSVQLQLFSVSVFRSSALPSQNWSHTVKVLMITSLKTPCTWCLRVIISSETAYSVDDLELDWARKLCLSQHSYTSVILLKAEISLLKTRSDSVTSTMEKKN